MLSYQPAEVGAPLLPGEADGLPEFVPPPPRPDEAPESSRRGGLITLRPAVHDDGPEIAQVCADTWADDPVPQVFDRWVDDDATVHVAEMEGRVVAVHRLDAARRTAWYEGLRVATSHRRRGIAATMLDTAINLARRQRCDQMLLTAAAPGARSLVEGRGFHSVGSLVRWEAAALPGKLSIFGLNPLDAEVACDWLGHDAGFKFHSGLSPAFGAGRGSDIRLLREMASDGHVRMAGDGAAMAGLLDSPPGEPIRVSFLAGSGASLGQLLESLRKEAFAGGWNGVRVLLPPGHPAALPLGAAGFANDDLGMLVYEMNLA